MRKYGPNIILFMENSQNLVNNWFKKTIIQHFINIMIEFFNAAVQYLEFYVCFFNNDTMYCWITPNSNLKTNEYLKIFGAKKQQSHKFGFGMNRIIYLHSYNTLLSAQLTNMLHCAVRYSSLLLQQMLRAIIVYNWF